MTVQRPQHHRTARHLAPRVLAPVAAAALVVGLAGCGDEQAPTAARPSTTTVTETPTATAVPSTPADTATSTPTEATPSSPATSAPVPEGAVPYADALVIAWGSGERERALQLATPEVVNTLFSAHDPGGPHWDQVATEGAAGTIFVTYQDTKSKQQVVIGVQNEASSKRTEHAATQAKFLR